MGKGPEGQSTSPFSPSSLGAWGQSCGETQSVSLGGQPLGRAQGWASPAHKKSATISVNRWVKIGANRYPSVGGPHASASLGTSPRPLSLWERGTTPPLGAEEHRRAPVESVNLGVNRRIFRALGGFSQRRPPPAWLSDMGASFCLGFLLAHPGVGEYPRSVWSV